MRINRIAGYTLCLYWLRLAVCQSSIQAFTAQSDSWNSSFSLTERQIEAASLDNQTAFNANIAVQFERSNWAGQSVHNDSFYTAAANSSSLPAGSLLTVEEVTNTSLYTLPPNVALSRITFVSETLNGSTVPVSGYVLWPWMPREDPKVPGKYAMVGWAHGTSGAFGECAPSHIRNLWYQYSGPYILALQGYVVVAPDYAGLGITKTANGSDIKLQYFASPAQANDLFNAIAAARTKFTELSPNFVLIGHSEGGGVAWASAQRQATQPVPGYLGSIAVSPITNVTTELDLNPSQIPLISFCIANMLDTIFPDFRTSEFLTDKGVQRLELLKEINGCNSAVLALTAESNLTQPDFMQKAFWRDFVDISTSGGRAVAGPLLVLQGTGDQIVAPHSVTAAVNNTCAMDPNTELEYQVFDGTDHVPTMYAAQRVWLDWIADRFAGREAGKPCTAKYHQPARPVNTYQKELNLYLEYATQMYQVG